MVLVLLSICWRSHRRIQGGRRGRGPPIGGKKKEGKRKGEKEEKKGEKEKEKEMKKKK